MPGSNTATANLGPALNLLRHLWRLNHALERLSGRMDKRLSITAQQRLVIRCIGACAGLTPGALADLLHVDPGTVSATLSRLQDKRLVSRHKDPSDLRRAFISLTARGRALDRPTDGTVESAVQALLSQTSTADIETTVRVLTTLANLLDEQHTPRARTPLDEVPG